MFGEHRPDAVMHLAAESHVDRSIDGPADFIQTNIWAPTPCWKRGLLERNCRPKRKKPSASTTYPPTRYTAIWLAATCSPKPPPIGPNSPYSASKACSDHLVRAWHHTYGLPVVTTNCSNNYGPYQFPEKLIPLMILNALQASRCRSTARAENIRDWLYVEDHARALVPGARPGPSGETYNIGGHNEKRNLEVVKTICDLSRRVAPTKPQGDARLAALITFVKDRPGHDLRYAIDASKIQRELGWRRRKRSNRASARRCSGTWKSAMVAEKSPARLQG